MQDAPCKDCTERVVTTEVNCHSYCERYKAYDEAREALRQARIKHNNELQEYIEYRQKLAKRLRR